MEHFIDTVRRYPCLWNTAAIEYRDQELKDAAWAEVMKETDLSSVKEVKLKWKKLRDSYRDALKRQGEAREAGAGAKKPYPWKYSAHMQFLQPYIGNRKKAAEAPAPPAPPAADDDSSSSSSGAPPERRCKRRASPPPAAPDPLDIFFNGMCQSTKRLPFQAQIEIKKTLFGAVIAAEQALLQHHQTYAGLWPRPRSSSSEPSDRAC